MTQFFNNALNSSSAVFIKGLAKFLITKVFNSSGSFPNALCFEKVQDIDDKSSSTMSRHFRLSAIREIVVSFIVSLDTAQDKAKAISVVISFGGLGGSVLESPPVVSGAASIICCMPARVTLMAHDLQ